MDRKPDHEDVPRPPREGPRRALLRLVPREDRELPEPGPSAARRGASDRKIQQASWEDDDDPGPAAA